MDGSIFKAVQLHMHEDVVLAGTPQPQNPKPKTHANLTPNILNSNPCALKY